MLHYLITFYYINVMKILLLDYTFFMLLTHTPNFMFIIILFTIWSINLCFVYNFNIKKKVYNFKVKKKKLKINYFIDERVINLDRLDDYMYVGYKDTM